MRRFPRWKALAAAMSLGAALLFSPPAEATVAVPVDRAQQVGLSDLIVRATVTARSSMWNADHSQIVTLTRLRVTAWVKGAGTSELVLRQLGGTVGDTVMQVSGDAHFTVGQDAVLFLRRGDGVVFLTAMAQSAYYVQGRADGTPMVHRDLHGLTFARMRDGQMQFSEPGDEAPETLRHLLDELNVIVQRPRVDTSDVYVIGSPASAAPVATPPVLRSGR